MSPLELNGVKKLSRDLVINSNKTLMKVQKDTAVFFLKIRDLTRD